MAKNKVFIVWSGALSHQAALALKNWLPKVIQAIMPFMSSEDIRKGDRWLNEISKQLEETNSGILCLTPSNLNAPWILFETGALSKNIEKSSICPLLLGLSSTNLKQPLSQFQDTRPNKEDIFKLVETINEQLGNNCLEKDILRESFDMRWPNLKSKLDNINELVKKETIEKGIEPKRSPDDILEELLGLGRSIAHQLNDLTKSPPPLYTYGPGTLGEIINLQHTGVSRPGRAPTVSGGVIRRLRSELAEKEKSEEDITTAGDQIREP